MRSNRMLLLRLNAIDTCIYMYIIHVYVVLKNKKLNYKELNKINRGHGTVVRDHFVFFLLNFVRIY